MDAEMEHAIIIQTAAELEQPWMVFYMHHFIESNDNMSKAGVIYILTNPSFPEYVKIGYSDDLNERLKQLNRSECTPFGFRVYATYDVPSRLTDKKVHEVIDQLNPELRSRETLDGKERVREFFEMSAEDAYSIFEAMATIHDCRDNLKRWEKTEEERFEEKTAEMARERIGRSSNFSFTMCGIPPGERIVFVNDPDLTITVYDDRKVEYCGEVLSPTALAKKLYDTTRSLNGFEYFTYEGELLRDRRRRMESDGTYGIGVARTSDFE